MQLPQHARQQRDLMRHAVDRAGRVVAVAWSASTGEVYTYTEDGADTVLEILGWVADEATALGLRDSSPIDPQGSRTLVEAVVAALARPAGPHEPQ
jgi:hypothetical protein